MLEFTGDPTQRLPDIPVSSITARFGDENRKFCPSRISRALPVSRVRLQLQKPARTPAMRSPPMGYLAGYGARKSVTPHARARTQQRLRRRSKRDSATINRLVRHRTLIPHGSTRPYAGSTRGSSARNYLSKPCVIQATGLPEQCLWDSGAGTSAAELDLSASRCGGITVEDVRRALRQERDADKTYGPRGTL